MSIIQNDSISLAQLMLVNCTEKMADKAVKTLLSNYSGLMGYTQVALRAFLMGDLPDPLVGENACQIRAVLYSHLSQDHEIVPEIEKVCEMIEKNSGPLAKVVVGKTRLSLMDVLEANQLNICVPNRISSTVCSILYGHILTVTKTSILSIKDIDVSLMESNDIKLLAGVTKTFARDLIKESRRSLASYSINYLRSEVRSLPMSPKTEHLIEVMERDVLSDPLGLQTAPLLPGMQILLASMKRRNISIVLRDHMRDRSNKEMRTVVLLFNPTGQDGRYEAVENLGAVNKDQSGFVVEAVAISDESRDNKQLASSLITVGIETIILANCAAHPQYGGGNKGVEPLLTEERECLKERAVKQGLCATNPELCRIYHIFAGLLSKHLLVKGSLCNC
jgi:hypothetical protein